MTLEGSRKFWIMVLGLIGTWIIAKYGAEWGAFWTTAQGIMLPLLASGLYMLFNYLQKTTKDTFVPDNWLAGKRIVIGGVLAMLAPILTSMTIEQKDTTTQMITWLADLGIPALFMLFQHLSDKKLAAVPEVAKPVAPVYQPVITPVIAPATTTSPEPIAAPIAISQVKDRIASTLKLINHETKWDFLMGIWTEKIEAAKKHLLSVNPNMTETDMNKLLSEYAGGVLSEADCSNVRSVMGLPQVLHAKNDLLILKSMQTAEKAKTLGKAMSETYLKAAIKGVQMDIVNEAIGRVINDALPVSVRRLALMEFGLSQDEADRAMFSGGQVMIFKGGNWRDFNGFQLAEVDVGL